LHEANVEKAPEVLRALQKVAIENGNIFESLLEAVKCCSLGQITRALYAVGGQYRRNM
jgi:methylmalonyl-CoA mutase